MEEVDGQFIALLTGQTSTVFQDALAVTQFVDSNCVGAATGAGGLGGFSNAAGARKNFLIDSSTPHGDVIISEASVLKPSLGWITTFATESLRRGVHEWCVKIEHQGETSDGSGLMVGIVPKSFSKFDSFISQGGGWCLSRAGKLYGHWRRVDNNTSVGSLTFGTGDRVIFQLDFDSARMSVRVGDRSITGEISGLSPEVFPAISLHYRHQHVRFEYHKIHDRNVAVRTWVERSCFPSAVLYLPATTTEQLRKMPLDVYVLSSAMAPSSSAVGGGCHAIMESDVADVMEPSTASAAAASPASAAPSDGSHPASTAQIKPSGSPSVALGLGLCKAAQARLTILLRALSAIRRFRAVGQGAMEHFLSTSVTAEYLREQAVMTLPHTGGAADRRGGFGANAAALLMTHIGASMAAANGGSSTGNVAFLAVAATSLVHYLIKQPLFSVAENSPSADVSPRVLTAVNERLRIILSNIGTGNGGSTSNSAPQPTSLTPYALSAEETRLRELQVVLAIQSGSVANTLWACHSLLTRASTVHNGDGEALGDALGSGAGVDASPRMHLSLEFVQWYVAVVRATQPQYVFPLAHVAAKADASNTIVRIPELARHHHSAAASTTTPETAPPSKVLSMATDGEYLYLHTQRGLEKWGLGTLGTIPRAYALTTDPVSMLQGCAYSSLACNNHRVLLHTDRMGAEGVAVLSFFNSLALDQTIRRDALQACWPSGWSSHVAKLTLASGGSHVALLATLSTASTAPAGASAAANTPSPPPASQAAAGAPSAPLSPSAMGDPGNRRLPIAVSPAPGATTAAPSTVLSGATLLSVYSSFPAVPIRTAIPLRSQPPALLPDRCVLLQKDTLIPLGDPQVQLCFASGGHATVEMWVRLLGRGDEASSSTSRMLYCHGDRSTTGEVFIELCTQDNTLCIKGGYRHDNRGSSAVAVYLPPGGSGAAATFAHIALVFNGTWSLLLDGEAMASVLRPPSAVSSLTLERPRLKWCLGGGCVAHVAELRVWGRDRSASEIVRDMRRCLIGDEVGLLAYFPLRECTGCTLYNLARVPTAQHARCSAGFIRETLRDHPISVRGAPLAQSKDAANSTTPAPFWMPLANGGVTSCNVAFSGSVLLVMQPANPDVNSGGRLVSCFDPESGFDLNCDSLVPTASPLHAAWMACEAPQAADGNAPRLWCLTRDLETAMALSMPPLHSSTSALPTNVAGPTAAQLLQTATTSKAPTHPEQQQGVVSSTKTVALWLLALLQQCSGHGARQRQLRSLRGGQDVSQTPEASASTSTPTPVVPSVYATGGDSLLFTPLDVDVGKDVVNAATTLLRDHFRHVNVANARRILSLKDPASAFVIDVVLCVLGRQIASILEVKLDPRPLDLPINAFVQPPGGAVGQHYSDLAASTPDRLSALGTPVMRPQAATDGDVLVSTTPLMSKLSSSMRLRTPTTGGGGQRRNEGAPMSTAAGGNLLVPLSLLGGAQDDLAAGGILSSSSLGAQLVSTLCDIVNATDMHAALHPASSRRASDMLRNGVLLFFPDDTTRVQLLGEMLDVASQRNAASLSVSSSSVASSAGAAALGPKKPSVQALLGGVLEHFTSLHAVATIQLAPTSPLEPSLPWAAGALLRDASYRCRSVLTSSSSSQQALDSPEAQGSQLCTMHRSTLQTLAMVQMFLLSILDTSDEDATKSSQPDILAARQALLGARAHQRTSAAPSVAGTPPPPLTMATPMPLATPPVHAREHPPPNDEARDALVKDHFNNLFTEIASILDMVQQKMTAPSTFHVHDDWVVNLLRTSLTGNVLLTALTSVPLVVSLSTAPWMLDALTSLMRTVGKMMPQVLEGKQGRGGAGVAGGDAARVMVSAATPSHPLEDLHAAVRRHLSWLASYMVTCAPARRTEAAQRRAPTPPADDLPSAQVPSAISLLCSHRLCSAGLTTLLDQTPRGHACADLIAHSSAWMSRMRPPQAIDKVGTPEVNRAWVHLVAAALHLSTEPIAQGGDDLHRRLDTAAAVAVKCRPLKQKLLEWRSNRPSTTASNEKSIAQLQVVCEVCLVLLHLRCEHDRALGIDAAMRYAVSVAGIGPSRDGGAEAKPRRLWRNALRHVRSACRFQRIAAFTSSALSMESIVLVLGDTLIPRSQTHEGTAADAPLNDNSSSSTVDSAAALQRAFAQINHDANVRCTGLRHLVDEASLTDCGGSNDNTSHQCTALADPRAAALERLQMFSNSLSQSMQGAHYLTDVSGCAVESSVHIRTMMHRLIDMGLHAMAPCSGGGGHSARGTATADTQLSAAICVSRLLLNHRWSPEDFIFFTASDTIGTVFRLCCSIFTQSSEATPRVEPPTERTHRVSVRERQKLRSSSVAHAAGGIAISSSGPSPTSTTQPLGQTTSPLVEESLKPMPMTLLEEAQALSWTAVKELLLQCVEHMQQMPDAAAACTAIAASSLVHRRGCEAFLTAVFATLTCELQRCAIYMSHFYYPAQERVSDHVTSLCSLIATTARALIGDGAQSPCTSSLTSHTMRSLSKPAALLLLLGHTSSYGASVPPIVAEHAVRTAGLVFECAHPGIADEALKGAVEDMLSAAATADALTSARVIASRESPCVHLLHLIAQSTRSASESTASSTSSSSTTTHQPFLSRLCVSAIKVLSRLAAKTVWTASIRSLIARGLRQLSAALSPDTPTDQRREASISTLLTTFAACGLDADTPQLGSEVRYCIDGELRLSELGFVVDLNLAAQTALVVPANVYDYTNCETEVPLDALRCAKGDMHLPCFPEVNGAGQFPTAPSPFSVGRLPTIPLLLELLRPSIAMVVDHAHVVQSNAIISAALATWLRVLSTILLHDPLVCNMLSHDGTLHRLYDAYGQRPIASPLPLPYLREASAIALSLHLRSASGLRGAHASFSRFDTAAGNGEGATDLNAFRFSSPAMAVVGGASSSSSPLFAASMLHSSDAALVAGLAPAPLRSSGWLPSALLLRHPSAGLKCVGRALPALQTGVTLELSFFVHDFFSQAQLGESFAVPTAWSKPSVRCRLFGLVDAEGSVVMGIDMVDDRLVLGFPLAAASDTTRNASSVGGTVYDEDEDDEEYNDDEDDDEDDDQLIRHAESAPPISTSRRARRRSASRVPSAIPLMPIPRTECLERWTRLAVILHHNEVLVYRDGELGAIQTYDQAWTGIRPMHALHVGQWVGSDSSESSSQQYHAPVSIRNLRVWPLPVPKHALRNLHEHSDSATHHGLVPDMSFSLSDGTGPVALSDDGQTTAHLLGDIHWGPQLPFASSTTTMTLELDIEQARVQQQQPDAATAAASASQVPGCAPDGYTAVLPSAEERRFHWSSLPPTSDPDEGAVEFTIPRKEIYAHYAALDPQHLNIVVTNMFGSLVGHYVRRGMLHALETLMSARAQVALVNRTMVDIRSVLRVHDVVSAVANLVRYSVTANLPQRNVMTATRFLEAHLMSQLKSVEGDDELTHNTLHRFLDDAMHQLNNEHERFDVEIFYTSIGASIECQALPLSILNGGSGTLSFECPRSMEYLFLFGDKQQKSSLAKFPDAQGSWPDVDITVSGPTSWCFAKPSAALKAAPARFRLKVPSHRPVVGHYAVQLLCEVLASRPDKEAEVVLDQRLLAVHASAVRSTRGERRLGHMATMTKLILLWAQRPLVHPNDRTPLILLLDRINTFFFHTERRNALYPASVFMLPGVAVYPPVIRRAAELLTAAIQLETAWTNAPPLLNVHAAEITTCCRSFTKSWQRLCTLQQDAMEVVGGRETSSSDNHCAAGCMVTLCKPPSSSVSASTSSSVSWRRRCRGVWFASCDRGWQTVMSSIGFTRGRWYFEVRVPTNGSPIAAGIITKQFKGLMEVSSSSLGHCGHSWGFDGSRLCRWHNGIRNEFSNRTKWKSRDVVGILLDLEGGVLSCTHNGKAVGVPYENLLTAMAAHNKASTGTLPTAFFPAVSFTTSGCDINFGASPFIFDLPAGFLPVDVSQFRARSGMSIVSALVLVDLSHRLQQNREASDVSQNNNEAEPPAALARAMTAAVARRRLSCPREVERAGPSDVVFFQADRKQRSFDTEIRTGETGCIVQASAVVLGTGKWYYEIAIHGDGQVHLGWAALPFAQRTIGDDAHSWGIDGCHMVARHNRQQRSLGRHPWRDGDIIGCFLDADEGHVGFTINGQPLRDLHDSTGNGTLFHIKDAASMSFAPVVQLEPNATVHVLTNASDQNFIPRGFCALGDGDAVFSAVVEYLTSSAPVPPVGGDSATATSSIHKESSLSSGRRSWLVRPVHLRLFVEAIGRIHDLNAFANQAWSTQEAVRCHLPAIKDYVASEARSNFDDSDVENCLRWVSLTEGLLHDVARFIAPWEGGTSYPTQDAASYSLNAAARFLLRTAVSPVLGLRQMHLLLTSTNRVVGEHVKLTLNRRKAMAMLNHTTSLVDRHRYSMFGQINSLVGKKPSSMFLTGKRLWSVVFAGEGADDVGGPYREALSELCSEVMSAGGLSLFTPSSNQAQSVGPVQDRFTVHPNPPSPVSSACYVFLGRIMGGSLRSGELLPLYLPPPFWMLLLGNTTLGANELGHVDMAMLQSLTALAEELCVHERQGDDDDQAAYEERFTTYNVSGRSIPLFHNSERIPVTRANIDAYTSLVSYFRLMCEGRCAWDAIIQGFSQVVPATAISALKWFEVEQLVCGQSDFDVERLLSTARFEGITATDRRIEFLRNVLVSMTKRDRALFMRFVSGRERLPSGMRLKIMSSAKSGNNEDYDDDHLPHASTCFFWLSIPNYSTQEVLREKLLFAIHQCFDIDADFRVRGDQEDEDLPPTAAVRDQEDEDEFEDYRHLL